MGERYFPIPGYFICPDDDMYMFFWTIITSDEERDRSAEVCLMMAGDGEEIEVKCGPRTSRALTASYSKSSSTQAVVQCQEDQAIYIRSIISDGEKQKYLPLVSSFSGYRLSVLK